MSRFRFASVRAFFALACGIVLAWSGFFGEASSAPRYSAHVYVLRGFMNVFSPGMDTLTEEIRKRGIPASVHNHLASSGLAAEAIQNYRNGRARTIIIIGHSLGASAAASMAQELAEARVPVRLLVTLDPVARAAIPANVGRAYNFYDSEGIGTSTQRATNNHHALTNVDRKDLNHVSITTAPDIHRKVLGYILAAVAPERAAAAPARSPPSGLPAHAGRNVP